MKENSNKNREKSIEKMTYKAQATKEEMEQRIMELLSSDIENTFGQVEEFKAEFLKESLSLGISFESEVDMEKLKQDIISYLRNLQAKIEETDVTLQAENQLEAFDKIDKYKEELESKIAAILEIPIAYFKRSMQQISNKRKQKEDYRKQRHELEKEEMYLKGKLDTVLLGSKKDKVKQQIEQIRLRIIEIDNAMLNLNKKALEENDENSGLKQYIIEDNEAELTNLNESTTNIQTQTITDTELGEK